MEIAWLEVSIKRHIDRMQETPKVNYVHYGKGSMKGKSKPRPNGSSSGSRVNAGNPGKPHGKSRKFNYPLTSIGDVEKVGTKKDSLVKLWKQLAETVEQRVTMRKCVWSQPTWWTFQGLPLILNLITSMNMETLCMHTHMVCVKENNQNEHHPISHWYSFQESEELAGLFHCSVES